MQNVPNKRFRNSLNDKFWMGTFFTINLFLQLLASLQAFIALFSLSGRRQNECSTRMQLQKRKETVAITSEKKKAANNVSVLGAFSPSFPLISFRFLSVRLVSSPPQAKAPYRPFLLSLFLLWIPTILTLYINTTLVVTLFSQVDESFSGSKMSCHFLIRKHRSI